MLESCSALNSRPPSLPATSHPQRSDCREAFHEPASISFRQRRLRGGAGRVILNNPEPDAALHCEYRQGWTL